MPDSADTVHAPPPSAAAVPGATARGPASSGHAAAGEPPFGPQPSRPYALDPVVLADVDRLAGLLREPLVALRRDLHAHPELGYAEVRSTAAVRARLQRAGLHPEPLPAGSGLICDVGAGERRLGLRADLDALPVPDLKEVTYRSTVPGVCHACGHDVHTAVVLGAGLLLAGLAAEGHDVPAVRLVFQPAEELMPGGSQEIMAAGGIDGLHRILAVHCDPRLEVGTVGLRAGAITSACDRIGVRLRGRGGHTARPHLTEDLIHALGTLLTGLPAALSRRLDPRWGVSLVWGRVRAGHAANAIPGFGEVEGTVRYLDPGAWHEAPVLLRELAQEVVAPYGVDLDITLERGVPPVVNERGSAALLRAATEVALGADAVQGTDQSLGAEDFAWYLDKIPGALARLGVRRPGDLVVRDLHQGDFDPDEAAITVGARLLAVAALLDGGEPPGAWSPVPEVL